MGDRLGQEMFFKFTANDFHPYIAAFIVHLNVKACFTFPSILYFAGVSIRYITQGDWQFRLCNILYVCLLLAS